MQSHAPLQAENFLLPESVRCTRGRQRDPKLEKDSTCHRWFRDVRSHVQGAKRSLQELSMAPD